MKLIDKAILVTGTSPNVEVMTSAAPSIDAGDIARYRPRDPART